MKNSIAAFLLAAVMIFTLCGCGTQAPETPNDPGFSFSDLTGLEFQFSSGAGGWATVMTIAADGSFSGRFHDSNMGDVGDDYPNGTLYESVFSGRFSEPVQENEYTWSTRIEELTYAREPGDGEIIDGTMYIYTDVYGLNDAERILIYLPGAPLEELPEEFRGWIGYYDLSYTEDTELPFYALNNESQQQGFRSHSVEN